MPALRAENNAPATHPLTVEAAKPAAVRLLENDDNKVYSIASGYDVTKDLSALVRGDVVE